MGPTMLLWSATFCTISHPEKGLKIVRSLADKLNPTGFIVLREPIKKSHGIPLEEIRSLHAECRVEGIRRHGGQEGVQGEVCQGLDAPNVIKILTLFCLSAPIGPRISFVGRKSEWLEVEMIVDTIEVQRNGA